MDKSKFDRQRDALNAKAEAEWLADRVGDICEDFGSTNRTVAGIADPKQRARCETLIAREKRDHEKGLRTRAEELKIHRAEQAERLRLHDQQRREADAKRERVEAVPKSSAPFAGAEVVSPAAIFERFNRRRTTGKR